MATIRFISMTHMNKPALTWPQHAFATEQCWLAENEPIGSIEHLANCKIFQEMNRLGIKYYVADHVDNSFDVLVPYNNAVSFTLLNQCQNCKYKRK